MISLIKRFYAIIDMELCMPDYGEWYMTCREKTLTYILRSIICLLLETIRDNIFPITIILIMTYATHIMITKILQNKQRNHRPQTNQNDQQQTKEPQHQPDCTQKQHHEVDILSEQPFSHPDNKPTNQHDTPTIKDDTPTFKDDTPTNKDDARPNLCSPQHIKTTNQKTKTYDAGKIKGPRDYGPKNKRAHRPRIKTKNIYIYIYI